VSTQGDRQRQAEHGDDQAGEGAWPGDGERGDADACENPAGNEHQEGADEERGVRQPSDECQHYGSCLTISS